MASIQINLPGDILSEIGADKARSLALEAFLVRLYDLGKISGGRAAEVLGISRRAFLDVLSSYGISEFDQTMDIAGEAQRA